MAAITLDVWEQALASLRQTIGEPSVRAWLQKARFEGSAEDGSTVVLAVPNVYFQRYISRHFLPQIEAALGASGGQTVGVRLRVDDELDHSTAAEVSEDTPSSAPLTLAGDQTDLFPPESTPARAPASARARALSPQHPSAPPSPFASHAYNRLNPRYTFEEYIVGHSNRYAHAAAQAVSDPNSKSFNPLFIYGGTGLGKTHLMQAIGWRMRQINTGTRVLYVTSEQFINHFIDSIQHKRSREFRSHYRNADLLLIDDVQFLMGKDRSQMEFFHTFNALMEAEKKVVVSSDRAPNDLAEMEDRLRSRFTWGLLTDIQPPDLETRIAILRKKAQADQIMLPNEVAIFVAERVTSHVRALEGVLKQLKVTASLHGRSIDLETAREVVGAIPVGGNAAAITAEDVQRIVCDYFNIRVSDMVGKNRSKKFSRPRHVAQYLCRRLTTLSFPDIAIKFGGKDHTSIIYACRKVESALRTDSNLANIVTLLTEKIRSATR
jgi:chromosomal replication initiator protein